MIQGRESLIRDPFFFLMPVVIVLGSTVRRNEEIYRKIAAYLKKQNYSFLFTLDYLVEREK